MKTINLKRSLKTRWLLFKDQFEVKLGIRHPLMQPKRYDYINIGVNTEINQEFFGYFVEQCGLQPNASILEVGSGFGRMAIPLTKYLSPDGSYDGLELLEDGVNWCQNAFTKRFPNFRFQRIDVYNSRYHAKGKQSANTYRFPLKDNSFDFVYLTSVFTHMYPDEISNYLKEISRVLKPRGTCLCTYYLINEVSSVQIEKGLGTYNFKHAQGDYFVEDMNDHLYQIAFHEELIKTFYNVCNLQIQEPIYYGSWSGRADGLSFQDIIIAKKVDFTNEL